ncbi:MAG: DegT/DnrJ/EryC1/StrS family aminotransferase [Ardenticatenaceae bacterium]|nr:DegT/DnrJ/EryC1/StrS family aminotransferase [Ardenticatenaceae bacterium]
MVNPLERVWGISRECIRGCPGSAGVPPAGRARSVACLPRPVAHPSPPRPRSHHPPDPVRLRRGPYALAARAEVIRRLAAAGIPSRLSFTPIHLQPFSRQPFGSRRGDFPVTEALGDGSLALPCSGVMSEAEVDEVCEQLLKV